MKYIFSTHSCYHFKVKSWKNLEGSRESSAVKNAMGFYGRVFQGWWAYWQEKLSAISVQVFCACIPAVKNTHAPESFFQHLEAVSYVVVTESIQHKMFPLTNSSCKGQGLWVLVELPCLRDSLWNTVQEMSYPAFFPTPKQERYWGCVN